MLVSSNEKLTFRFQSAPIEESHEIAEATVADSAGDSQSPPPCALVGTLATCVISFFPSVFNIYGELFHHFFYFMRTDRRTMSFDTPKEATEAYKSHQLGHPQKKIHRKLVLRLGM